MLMAEGVSGAIGAMTNLVMQPAEWMMNDYARNSEHNHQFGMLNRSINFGAEKQLELNSPQQQVARMRQAGVNPMLINGMPSTGSVSGNTGSSSGIGAPSAPRLDPLAAAQAANLEADTNLKEADAKLKEADARKSGVEADTMTYLLEKLPEKIVLEFAKMRSDADKNWSDVEVNDQTRVNMVKQLEEANKRIEMMDQQIKESNSQIAKNKTEMDLMKVTMKTQMVYAQCQAEQTILNSIQTCLNGYGLELTAAGLQIQKSMVDSDISVNEFKKKLMAAETELTQLEAKYKGQENVRAWISTITSGLRDLGIGFGAATGGIQDIAKMLSPVPNPIGFK